MSSGLRASQDSFGGLNDDGAEMPTKMKTKDGLRRKRGRRGRKRQEEVEEEEEVAVEEEEEGAGGGGGQRSQRSAGPGLCSPNMRGECMALTHTHSQ